MIFFGVLHHSLNIIILHLPLFACYLLLWVAYGEPAAVVGLDTQAHWRCLCSVCNSHKHILILCIIGSTNVQAKLHTK